MSFILFLGALGIAVSMLHFRSCAVDWDNSWTTPRMLRWAGQGVAVPALGFLIYCGGMGGITPPWIGWVAQQSGASWALVAAGFAITGLVVATTFWGAVTFAWYYVQVFLRVPRESRAEFAGLSGIWFLLTSPFWLGLIWGAGWTGSGLAASLALGFMLFATIPLIPSARRSPLYARAIGQIKRGKFDEAELEIIKQLENCQEDFDGWMLLAELYAVHFHDMGAAEQTISQLIEQENLNQAQLATALHRLAEWQLKLNLDPEGARITLGEIEKRLPGTNMERLARRRAEQLPANREAMQALQKVRSVHLPANADPFAPGEHTWNREEVAKEANSLAERLRQNPNDVEPRETFAWLLAERLGKVELAFEQLDLLREMPDQPDHKQARWLGLAAAWEFRHRQNRLASRQLMVQLVTEYPSSPEAFAAQRRLNLMEMEDRLAQRGRQQLPKIKI